VLAPLWGDVDLDEERLVEAALGLFVGCGVDLGRVSGDLQCHSEPLGVDGQSRFGLGQ
jgi:hypothetical protein